MRKRQNNSKGRALFLLLLLLLCSAAVIFFLNRTPAYMHPPAASEITSVRVANLSQSIRLDRNGQMTISILNQNGQETQTETKSFDKKRFSAVADTVVQQDFFKLPTYIATSSGILQQNETGALGGHGLSSYDFTVEVVTKAGHTYSCTARMADQQIPEIKAVYEEFLKLAEAEQEQAGK